MRQEALRHRLRHACSCYLRDPVRCYAGRAYARSGRSRSMPARRGSTSGERFEPPRRVGITAGADTIADLERQRGLHPVHDDRLLAPGTDDLETGNSSTRTRGPPSFRHRISLVSHRCPPSPMATDHKTPSRFRPCATGHPHSAAHQAQRTRDGRVTAGADPMTRRRHRHTIPPLPGVMADCAFRGQRATACTKSPSEHCIQPTSCAVEYEG